jgi:hypothetical protein
MPVEISSRPVSVASLARREDRCVLLDWSVGNEKRKSTSTVRSKSERRHTLSDLQDPTMLADQKRDLIKKILQLQRQKFKDNQARKSQDDFEQSTYSFSKLNSTADELPLLNG